MKIYKSNKRNKSEKKYVLVQRKKSLLGIMDVLILQWAKERPISGQEIMDRILKQFGVKIGPGTMYPILFSLKKRGLVKIMNYKKRKLYLLTNKGKIATKAFTKDYSKIQKSIFHFLK